MKLTSLLLVERLYDKTITVIFNEMQTDKFLVNTPEIQLIIWLTQTSLQNQVTVEIPALIKHHLDWKRLLPAAFEHRVVPLLFRSLKNMDGIPDEVRTEFNVRCRRILQRNLKLTHQMLDLIGILQSHNIEVIAYKGPVLAKFLYDDVSLRQFNDLDLLINRKDFPAVKQLFVAHGYQPAWKLTQKQEKAVLKYYYEYPFYKNETNTLLELHWDLLESFFSFDIKTAELFRRSEILALYNQPIKTLSVEDSLIILSVHGSKHFWKRLGWIADIVQLVKKPSIKWDVVLERAAQSGAMRALLLAMFLADTVLNADLPSEIAQLVARDKTVPVISKKMIAGLNAGIDSELLDKAQLHFQMKERSLDKIKYTYRLITTKFVDSLFMPMGRPR